MFLIQRLFGDSMGSPMQGIQLDLLSMAFPNGLHSRIAGWNCCRAQSHCVLDTRTFMLACTITQAVAHRQVTNQTNRTGTNEPESEARTQTQGAGALLLHSNCSHCGYYRIDYRIHAGS